MKDLKSFDLEELKKEIVLLNEQKFRAEQIFSWIHSKKVSSIDEMTNISKTLREKLKENYTIDSLEIIKKLVSNQDNTSKYLFALKNGTIIESVLMDYSYGSAICISTQAGCRMGCSFCASTLSGLDRNLTSGEMVSQIYEIEKDSEKKASHIVLMGSGEPLDNYDEVMKFVRIINSSKGANIGQRKITLSTCGLSDRIEKLMEEKLQITLAVSLHAPNDKIRQKIMPVARVYPIEELISVCKKYAEITGRRVTYEYALIDGINDSVYCAKELCELLRYSLSHINLIPINNVKERDYKKSTVSKINAFANILKEGGIEVTIRRELGSDINAACGQLRKEYINKIRT